VSFAISLSSVDLDSWALFSLSPLLFSCPLKMSIMLVIYPFQKVFRDLNNFFSLQARPVESILIVIVSYPICTIVGGSFTCQHNCASCA
jgi:hypothetical protein